MPVDFSKYGGKGTTTDTGSKTKIRADLSKYQTVTDPNARPVRPTQILPDIPSFDVTQSPLLQAVNAPIPTGKGLVPGRGAVEMDEAPRNINEELALKARTIPIIRNIYKGIDVPGIGHLGGFDDMANNPIVNKAAEIMRSFYVPGGGMANVTGLTGAAENAVSRLLPTLGNTVAGRVGQKALSEAVTGGVLGAGQEQMMNPDASATDLLKGAGYGAALGGGLGAIGKYAGTKLGNAIERWRASRNPIEQPAQPILALPQGRGESRYNAALDRSNLSPNQEPIIATGTVKNPEPLGLPSPNLGEATRARITTKQNEYTRKLENLFATANQMKLTPGKELEEVESLWSQMAGPKDPILNELIDLAYPKQTSKLSAESLSKARNLQQQMEVAGVPLKAKSLSDRYQPYAGDAGLPRERVGFGNPQVEITPPTRRFATQPKTQFKQQLSPKERIISNHSAEVPPIKNERRNFANQRENGNFSPEFNAEQAKRDLTYEPITNQETQDRVNARFEKESVDSIRASFQGATEATADHTLTGYKLIQTLDQAGRYEDAVNVAEKLAADLTKAGQTVQAASVLRRLSPEGQLLELSRKAVKNGKTVKPADAQKFIQQAKIRQEGVSSGPKTAQFYDLLDRINAGEKVSTEELKNSVESMLKETKQSVKAEKPPKPVKPRVRDTVLSRLEKEAENARLELQAKNSLGFARQVGTPDVVLYTKIFAHELAKQMVNIADFTEMLVKQYGEQMRPYAQEIYNGAKKLIGKADKYTTIDKEQLIEKFLKEGKFSEKDTKALRELAANINDLKGKQGADADIEMQRILNKYEKSSVLDKVNAIRYIAMLLNSGTQAVNAISGPTMASMGYLADILGSMIRPSSTTLYGSSPLRFMAGYMKNLKTGVKAGWHGANPSGITGTNEIRGLNFKSMYNPLSWAERGLGAIAKGADYATYKTVFDSELVKQGRLDARKQGIKGKENIQNHIKKYVLDPPPDAIEQADNIGKSTTFQRSDSLGGKTANWVNNSPKVVKPVVNAVLPFVKTPLNIASSAVTMTPAGIIKGLVQLANPASKASEREAIRNLSLGIMGSAGLGSLGYYLNKIGVITGANDTGDADANSINEQAGKGKYLFNTSALKRYMNAMLSGEGADAAEKAAQYQKGDHQFDYNKLQPLAFPIATGAALSENKDKPLLEQVGSAGESAFGSLYGMSSLQGLANLTQAPLNGSTLGQKAIRLPINVAESFFKSFSPSALAQEARRQDPTVRKTAFGEGLIKDTTDYFKSRTPGLSQTLPPQVTTLGVTKQYAPGATGQYTNPYKSATAPYSDAAKVISELMNKTGDLTLAPSPPEKKITGKDAHGKSLSVPIPADRYAKYQEDIGKEIATKVMALSPALSDAKKAERLKKIYSDSKAKYHDKLKKELGVK